MTNKLKQVGSNGKKAGLNVGAVLILPEGFQIAPPERIVRRNESKSWKIIFLTIYSRTKEYFSCWSSARLRNIVK